MVVFLRCPGKFESLCSNFKVNEKMSVLFKKLKISLSVFPYSYGNTSRSLREREFEAGNTFPHGECFHVILSSPKLPRVF